MRAVPLHSSGRFWTGLQADILETSGGAMEFLPGAIHHVSMHVGRPVRAECRVENRIHRRLQAPGNIDVIPMGCGVRWVDDGPTRVLSLLLQPQLFSTAARDVGLNEARVRIASEMQLDDPSLRHICWAIVAELEDGAPSGRVYGDSLGLALAAHLLQRFARTPRRPGGPQPSRRQVQLVRDYIEEHLSEDLGLTELAMIAGLSPSHFKVVFKSYVGIPVHQYIIRRRVEFVARLLLHGSPAAEAAKRAGFADQSHMARCMRRVLGMTPRDIRTI